MKRGSCREVRPGRWEFKVYVGRDPITRQKLYRYETVDADGQRDADEKLAIWVADILTGRAPAKTTAATVGHLLDRWYDAHADEWSPSNALETRRRIDGTLSLLAELDVHDVTDDVITEWCRRLRRDGGKAGRPLAQSTITRLVGDLSRAFAWAVSKGYAGLTVNPADGASVGRQRRRRIKPPTKDQVAALLAAAEEKAPDWLCFMFLAAESGARLGEIAALRLNDFGADDVRIERDLVYGLDTPENRRLFEGHCWPSAWSRGQHRTMLIEDTEPKNLESVRTISLAPETIELVKAQARRLVARAATAGTFVYPADGFLFPKTIEGDRPIPPATWGDRHRVLADGLGLADVRFHDIRHFVVTSLLNRGVDVATVAGRAGHGGGGKTTLAVYAAFLKEPDRAASSIMAEILQPAPVAPDAAVVQLDAARARRRR